MKQQFTWDQCFASLGCDTFVLDIVALQPACLYHYDQMSLLFLKPSKPRYSGLLLIIKLSVFLTYLFSVALPCLSFSSTNIHRAEHPIPDENVHFSYALSCLDPAIPNPSMPAELWHTLQWRKFKTGFYALFFMCSDFFFKRLIL